MASWFSSGTSELDQQIERATSSSLEDIATNLEISDLIRSKTVQPKDAMRSLKKRIGNKNPNIQLATLNLTDTCVKNGGSHFINEIDSREFCDSLTLLLRSYDSNEAVRSKILELIQTWAAAAESRHRVSYFGEVYRMLGREGFRFPPKEDVASSMFDSSAPPEWADSDVCMRCRTAFTFTNRKHHCRNCGNVFCGACSTKSTELPHLGITQAVRVDDGCYSKLVEKDKHRSHSKALSSFESPRPSRTLYQGSMQPRSARVEDSFDTDLKKALEMSLEEAKGESATAGSGFVPQSQLSATPKSAVKDHRISSKTARTKDDDEDPELKAAIAASLQDMEQAKIKHAQSLRQQQSGRSTDTNNAPAASGTRPNYELTPGEAENINLFSTLVDRLQHQPPGTVLREPQIQELYESIGSLRPRLARTYGETMSKHDTLLDLHSKLASVVRYYDRMLEERLSNTWSDPYGARNAHATRYQNSNGMYPNIGATMQNGHQTSNPESFYTSANSTTDPYPQPQYQPQTSSNTYNTNVHNNSQSLYGQQQPPVQISNSYQPPSAQPQHYTSPSYASRQRQPSSASTVSSQRTSSLSHRSTAPEYRSPTLQHQASVPYHSHGPASNTSTHEQQPQHDQAASYYYQQEQAPQSQPSHQSFATQGASAMDPRNLEAPLANQSSHYETSAIAAQPPANGYPQQQYPQSTQSYPPQTQKFQANPQATQLPSSAFPSAPVHQPVPSQPKAEESLIEL